MTTFGADPRYYRRSPASSRCLLPGPLVFRGLVNDRFLAAPAALSLSWPPPMVRGGDGLFLVATVALSGTLIARAAWRRPGSAAFVLAVTSMRLNHFFCGVHTWQVKVNLLATSATRKDEHA